MKTVKINNIEIGKGLPKICVPIVGRTRAEIMEQAHLIVAESKNDVKFHGCIDLAEWRADFFVDIFQAEDGVIRHENEIYERLKPIFEELNHILKDIPYIFTIRRQDEGGNVDLNADMYEEINRKVAGSGLVKLLDFEMSAGDSRAEEVIAAAAKTGTKVIVSYHDFSQTPCEELILDRLRAMQHLGGDIIKVAFMPETKNDIITLVSAAAQMKEKYAKMPMIIISMGEIGKITRLTGEAFGSDVTFGITKESSAPGQIDVKTLREALEITHNKLSGA